MPSDREVDEMLMNRGVGRHHACWREPQAHTGWTNALNRLVARSGKDGFLAVLLGIPGTGKTQMATEWLRFVLSSVKDEKNIEAYAPGWLATHVLYRKVTDVFRDIRETYDMKDKAERGVVDRFRHVQSLVLDEFDNQARTEFEKRSLRDIMDDRYREMRDTVLITNTRSRFAFLHELPEYLRSRLSECGLFIECHWPSFREKR